RSVLLPLPDEADEVATRELVDLAGQFLARDLGTALGRATDLGRAGLDAPPWPLRGLFFHTFGLFTLSWPRQAVGAAAAPAPGQRLVQRWASKDSKPVREVVQGWVQEQWAAQELGADRLIGRLHEACKAALGRDPLAVFHATVEPLAERAAALAAQRKGPPPE